MARSRLNLSIDIDTHEKLKVMSRRLGFRSPCAMCVCLLHLLLRGETGAKEEGGANIFSGFTDFKEYEDWERHNGNKYTIKTRQ